MKRTKVSEPADAAVAQPPPPPLPSAQPPPPPPPIATTGATAIGPYPPPDDGDEYAEYLPEPEAYPPSSYTPAPPQHMAPPPGVRFLLLMMLRLLFLTTVIQFGRIRGGVPEFIEVNAQALRATQSQQCAPRLSRCSVDALTFGLEWRASPLIPSRPSPSSRSTRT